MDSKTSGYTLSEQQQTFPASVFRIDDVRSQNEKHSHNTLLNSIRAPSTHQLWRLCSDCFVSELWYRHTSVFGFAALPENSRMWSPDFLSRRVFTSWWIFSGLMFTVWQFQVECVSAFEPASCSTLRWSRAVTSPLILKSGARIQIITEKLINVCLKVNNGQYLRIEGDEHGEGPHWCQNRFISTTHQI